jgi:hypothetical protein
MKNNPEGKQNSNENLSTGKIRNKQKFFLKNGEGSCK